MTVEPGVYPPIGELAVVGDGQSVALLGPDGRVEFLCPLRFDAPPLVWPLLDRERGGHLHVAPVDDVQTRMSYLQDTPVVSCESVGSLGRARTTIAMRWPCEPGVQELLWLVECIDGHAYTDLSRSPDRRTASRSPRWTRHVRSRCGRTSPTRVWRSSRQTPSLTPVSGAARWGRNP